MSKFDIEDFQTFQGFDQRQLMLLRSLYTFFYFPGSTVIFDQGEEATCFYILVEGDVTIHFKPEDGPPIIVTHVHPEAVIGWSAAIGSPQYTSSAICTSDCKILRIKGDTIRQLYQEEPGTAAMFLERLATMIEYRLQSYHPQLIALLAQGLSIKLDRLAHAV